MENKIGMGAEFVVLDEVQAGQFKAELIDPGMSWGVGNIVPQPETADRESQRALVTAALGSLEEVAKAQKGMSGCTDGRRPIKLLNGELVPARKQLVGGNLVLAFYMAESLGDRFYEDPTAPIEERINQVADFLMSNGYQSDPNDPEAERKIPSGHVNCGAGAGFAVVSANVPEFTREESGLFVVRNKLLLPDGVYDDKLHDQMIEGNERRASDGTYDALNPQMFLDAIERTAGKRGIAELSDDGRGVHGHVEEAILRMRVGNYAVNEAKLAEATGGREVFVVNDDEMDELAGLFGRGDDVDYAVARMAAEDFSSAGHGTLSKDLPTWRITAAA
jgi:hypothetical protein